MIDLLFNNGDLVVDKYGDLVMCNSEHDDIIQTANNNILLRFGSHRYHPDIGNKVYIRRIKKNITGMNEVAVECKNAIINGDNRVFDVLQVNVSTVEDDVTCNVDYILLIKETDDNGNEIDIKLDGRTIINIFNILIKDGE